MLKSPYFLYKKAKNLENREQMKLIVFIKVSSNLQLSILPIYQKMINSHSD